jgi:hypothetical protein
MRLSAARTRRNARIPPQRPHLGDDLPELIGQRRRNARIPPQRPNPSFFDIVQRDHR